MAVWRGSPPVDACPWLRRRGAKHPRFDGELSTGHEPDQLPERQAADCQHARELAEDLHEPAGTGRLLAGIELDDYGPDLGP